jgi:glycosyltransferase involved in cell wall biosynthesis/regulator of replication initiation timing
MSEQPATRAPDHLPRVLLISHDIIGSRMAGTGIRAWELARALAAGGQAVRVIAPQPVDLEGLDSPDSPHGPAVATGHYSWGDAASLAAWLDEADVVVANGYLLQAHPELAAIAQPLALDLYDPVLLENLELFRAADAGERAARYEQDRALLDRQMAAGDFFCCASETQRDLYLGALLAAGRVTPEQTDNDPLLRNLIDVVPFGLPSQPPQQQRPVLRGVLPGIEEGDPLLLWAGGLWDWLDPLALVDALPEVVAEYPQVRLVFLAGQHPAHSEPTQSTIAARARAAALGLLDTHIFFYDEWVPYAQRADFLLEADIAISLHRDHLETRYAAVRSRILDHLWSSLPSIISAGGPAADLLQQAGAALIVPEPDDVAVAIKQLLGDEMLRQRQAAAARMLSQTLTWEQVAAPLARFCREPGHTRPQPAAAPPAPVPPATPAPEPALDAYRLLEESRNAAIAVQEQTWNVQEQMPGAGRLAPARQQIVQQVVRPYVVPLLEQQRTYNIAVLRSIYAVNQLADHQRNDVLHTFNTWKAAADRRFDPLERGMQALEKHVGTLQGQVGALEKYVGTLQGQVGALETHVGTLQGQVGALETHVGTLQGQMGALEVHVGTLQGQVGVLQSSVTPLQKRVDRLEDENRALHQMLKRVDRLEHNNRALRQVLGELVEQISGLEDADTRLLLALQSALDQRSDGEARTDEQEQP